MSTITTIELDLNNPGFQRALFALTKDERNTVVDALEKLVKLERSALYRSSGFRWERISSLAGPRGQPLYSLRASQKIRLLAWREGNLLRILSIHADHDSAYQKR